MGKVLKSCFIGIKVLVSLLNFTHFFPNLDVYFHSSDCKDFFNCEISCELGSCSCKMFICHKSFIMNALNSISLPYLNGN